jgi:hypothetical protein
VRKSLSGETLTGFFHLVVDTRSEKYIICLVENILEVAMVEREVIVTPPKAGGSGHTKFECWGGDSFHSRFYEIDVRSFNVPDCKEAQIELLVSQTPNKGKRTVTICGSIVLQPEQARAFALALCPELAPK